jgi:hypothetical protein
MILLGIIAIHLKLISFMPEEKPPNMRVSPKCGGN